MEAGHNPSTITATQWQHTLAQRHRLGKRKTNRDLIKMAKDILFGINIKTVRLILTVFYE